MIYEDIKVKDWNPNKCYSEESTSAEIKYVPSTGAGFYTDLIEIDENSKFDIDVRRGWHIAAFLLFDSNRKVCAKSNGYYEGTTMYTGTLTYDDIKKLSPVAKYIGFSYYQVGSVTMRIKSGNLLHFANRNDPLFGKKYVACGDSFTCRLNPSAERPELVIPYPELIANRNNMDFFNEASGGERMCHATDPKGNRVFSESYANYKS